MDALVQTLIQEIPESVTTTLILEYTPRFIQEAQKLVVPGAEKKGAVLKALHTLIDLLVELQKVPAELATELNAFIDVTVAPTIDIIVGATKGESVLQMPQTVEEVHQKVNCFLQIIRTILSIVKVAKAKPAPAAVAEATEATEVAKVAEVKAIEATEAAEAADATAVATEEV